MKHEILTQLSPDYPWKDRLHWFDRIDSTNDYLKRNARLGIPHGTVVIAGHQTGGHGRRGRSFHSPEGVGIYFSMLLRPNCAVEELMHLTCAVGVSMCQALQAAAGITPGIKWINDLVYEKRKLGGILTELGFSADGKVDYAIIGIGINCGQTPDDFPPEIRDMAGSLSMVTGTPVSRSKVAAAMMEALHRMDQILLTDKQQILDCYRSHCVTLNQEVALIRGEEVRHGYALDVDDEGALIVRLEDGHLEAVNSGEVSVRGMYGYV